MKNILTFTRFALAAATLSFTACTQNEPTAASPAIPSETLATYIAIQETLAADSLEGVTAHAEKLATDLDSIDPAAAQAAREIAQTAAIQDARRHFETISNTLIASLRNDGIPNEGYFEAHCPMAFNNRGASWIQTNNTINNPYYGAEMLRCGLIRQKF